MLRFLEFWSGYSSDEPIALFRQGFNVGGIRGVIPQGEPDLPDGVVEPLVELNESGLTPNFNLVTACSTEILRLRLNFD